MVTITKDGRSIRVTLGAFRSLYKPMGYVIAGAEEDLTVPSAPGGNSTPLDPEDESDSEDEDPDEELDLDEEEEDEDEESEDELEEKPIGEMNFKELKEYAARRGISANGMNSKRELREAILASEEDD